MNKNIKIFTAGDSTAATKQEDKRPETGWGEKIIEFIPEGVEVCNIAANGRSTKSFMDEGRLKQILGSIGSGDFLFIQFSHNDEKEKPELHTEPFTTYKENLAIYVNSAREKGATPILLTPVCRRSFDENGKIVNTHGDYPAAMKEAAGELNVPLLDISARSKKLFDELGVEKSKEIFLWVKKGESENYPDGVEDNTHFCTYGAKEIARLIAEEIVKKQIKPLCDMIKL